MPNPLNLSDAPDLTDKSIQRVRLKSMPLSKKGKKILGAMKKQYGSEKGKKVFYASINKGTVKGAEHKSSHKSHRPPKKTSRGKKIYYS